MLSICFNMPVPIFVQTRHEQVYKIYLMFQLVKEFKLMKL
jgi:hypothetical protein